MSLLTFDSVSYKYAGSNTPEVLQNVNISFEKGVFYSIIGPSGSGKTTALSLAGGLDIPTGGVVRFEGRDIREIGYTEYRRPCGTGLSELQPDPLSQRGGKRVPVHGDRGNLSP